MINCVYLLQRGVPVIQIEHSISIIEAKNGINSARSFLFFTLLLVRHVPEENQKHVCVCEEAIYLFIYC